jgi:hypothetical protein
MVFFEGEAMTRLLDAAAWPFYAIGKLYGYTLRVLHWAALAVQIGIEEGRGEHGTITED